LEIVIGNSGVAFGFASEWIAPDDDETSPLTVAFLEVIATTICLIKEAAGILDIRSARMECVSSHDRNERLEFVWVFAGPWRLPAARQIGRFIRRIGHDVAALVGLVKYLFG